MKKKIKKMNKLIILIFILIVTEIFISYFSYSKYTSQTVSTDSAKAATFIIDAYSNDTDIEIDCNEEDTAVYTLQVTNADNAGNVSDVSTRYSIIVEFEEKLPEEAEITLLDKDDKEKSYTISDDNLIYTFENVGEFQPGKTEIHELKLKFLVDADNMEDFKDKKVSINVKSEQVN